MPINLDDLVSGAATAYRKQAATSSVDIAAQTGVLVDTLDQQRQNAEQFVQQESQLIDSFGEELKGRTAESKANLAMAREGSSEVNARILAETQENQRLAGIKESGNIFQKIVASVKMGINNSQIVDYAERGTIFAQQRAANLRDIETTASTLYTTEYQGNWQKIKMQKQKWAEIERVDTKKLQVITSAAQDRKQDLFRDYQFAKDERATQKAAMEDPFSAANPMTQAVLAMRGLPSSEANLRIAGGQIDSLKRSNPESYQGLSNMLLTAQQQNIPLEQLGNHLGEFDIESGMLLASFTGQEEFAGAIRLGVQAAAESEFTKLSRVELAREGRIGTELTGAEIKSLRAQAQANVISGYKGNEVLSFLKDELESENFSIPVDRTFQEEEAVATLAQTAIENNAGDSDFLRAAALPEFWSSLVQPQASSAEREGASALAAIDYLEGRPEVEDPIGVVAKVMQEFGKRYLVNSATPAYMALSRTGLEPKPQVLTEVRPTGLGSFFGSPVSQVLEAAKGKYNLADKNDLLKFRQIKRLELRASEAFTPQGVPESDPSSRAGQVGRILEEIKTIRGEK